MLLLASCDKEETSSNCSVCTVITSNSSTGESSEIFYQSDLGCDLSQDEYMEELELDATLDDINTQSTALMFGNTIEVSHTITCVYE